MTPFEEQLLRQLTGHKLDLAIDYSRLNELSAPVRRDVESRLMRLCEFETADAFRAIPYFQTLDPTQFLDIAGISSPLCKARFHAGMYLRTGAGAELDALTALAEQNLDGYKELTALYRHALANNTAREQIRAKAQKIEAEKEDVNYQFLYRYHIEGKLF